MNGAVEVVCVGDTAFLRDLGLSLTRGERASLTLASANRSRDLEDAKSRGIVEVNVVKAQTLRTEVPFPAPPSDSPNHKTIVRSALHAGAPNPPAPEPASVDLSPVLEAIRALTREVRELKETVGKLELRPVFLEGGATVSAIRAEVFPKVEEPVFIPAGIVDPTLTAEVNLSSTTTGGVSEAEEALRNLRKKKIGAQNG